MTFLLRNLIFILLIAVCCSCNKDKDYVYPETVSKIVSIINTGNPLQFKEDITNRIYTSSEFLVVSGPLAVGDRVYITFSCQESKLSDGTTGVKVFGCQKILSKKVSAAEPAVLDTIPDDPVEVESVWRSANFINTRINLEYYNTPHTLGLYCNSTTSNADTINLELRHGLNADKPGTIALSYASFDIDSLATIYPKAVVAVRINSTNYGNKKLFLK